MVQKRFSVIYAVLLFVILVGGLFIIYNNLSLTGFAVENSGKLQKLKIDSVCSNEPDVYQTWKVWNKNNLDLEFSWSTDNTDLSGFGIALADGYGYFNTSVLSDSDAINIFVKGIKHDEVKVSHPMECEESEDNGDLIEINQTSNLTIINETIINQTEINSTDSNLTEINIINSTFVNETGILNETFLEENQTIINQTVNVSVETTVLNETSNETILSPVVESSSSSSSSGSSSSGGGGGGGSSGGSSSVSKVINKTNQTISKNESSEVLEEVINESPQESSVNETQEEGFNFFRIAGNVIKGPLEMGKGLFSSKNKYIGWYFIGGFILILSIVLLVRRARKVREVS